MSAQFRLSWGRAIPKKGGEALLGAAFPFPFEIQRSARRHKTLAIHVKAGQVIIKTPLWTSDAQIKALLQARQSWIHKHLQDQIHAAQPIQMVWKKGESILYLGQAYALPENFERKALRAWLIQQATPLLMDRTAYFSKILGVSPQKVIVKEYKARWGSCSVENVIRYNWKIIQAPLEILDYLVVHELAHIKIKNHGQHFWSLVHSVLPHARSLRKDLQVLAKGFIFF